MNFKEGLSFTLLLKYVCNPLIEYLGGLGAFDVMCAIGNYYNPVYPNPVIDEIKIDLTALQTTEPVLITLSDVQGKILFRKEENQHSIAAISTSELSNGVYFVCVKIGAYAANYKIVK